MILVGAVVFLACEIGAFVAVADQIGVLWALLLLFGVSALGPAIVRRVGLGVIAHTQQRLAEGGMPTAEIMDGFVVLLGGALIAVPGFVGDAIGLSLMLGPVRRLVVKLVGHHLAGQVHRFAYRGRPGFVDSGIVDARSWEPGTPGGSLERPSDQTPFD